jgi:hypothetical protein
MSHHRPFTLTIALVASLAFAAACETKRAPAKTPPPDSVAVVDTSAPPLLPREPARPALSPLADSIADKLVFVPRGQVWFTAAARGKRLLVDLGRVDTDVKKDTARAEAYLEAVRRLSPIPVGTRFRLAGPWGADSAVLTDFASWSGRIVGVLGVGPRVDSIAKNVEPLPVSALRVDSFPAPVTDNCKRDSLSEEILERAGIVRDSIQQQLLADANPPYERLRNNVRVSSSRIIGCYGKIGHVLLIVSLRAGNNEYVTERYAIVDDTGWVTPMRGSDYRFPAHDGVYALDADRDGVDDIATRAIGEYMGGLTILRVDTARKRLDRLTSGFAWESR